MAARSVGRRYRCLSTVPTQHVRHISTSLCRNSVRAFATVEMNSTTTPREPYGLGSPMHLSPTDLSQKHSSFHPIARISEVDSRSREPRIIDGSLYVPSGTSGLSKASGYWLRDICSSPESRNQDTSQRQINVFKMGREACTVVDVTSGPKGFTVTFADGHKSVFTSASLVARNSLSLQQKRDAVFPLTPWTAASIEGQPPKVDYSTVASDSSGSGMAALMTLLRTYGFAFVDNTPATPEASEALLESIGPIRTTHYGGFYDFTADLSSKDTAYTSEALEPHTDNTYFTEPAGLQALHMLSHTDGSGGASSLVDGVGAAAQLFEIDPAAYTILSTTGVYAHASGNEGISVQPSHAFPTLGHHPRLGHLMQVRWNNADRAGVAVDGQEELDKWYDAAGKYDALLSDPKNMYWFQLNPGRMLIFDNWRVLHGRASFTGKRRMCGGYINRDDYISKLRMTTLGKDDIRESIVTG